MSKANSYEPPDNIVRALARDIIEANAAEERIRAVLKTWLRYEVRRINILIDAKRAEELVP